jgi:hypothetical protein
MAIIPDNSKWQKFFEVTPDSYTESITFILPSKKRNGKDMWMTEKTLVVDGTMKFLLKELGGATMTEGKGFYEDDTTQKLVHVEDVVLCRSLTTKSKLEEKKEKIVRMANSLAVIFEQHSLAVEINGTMHFFAPTARYRENYEKYYKKEYKSGRLEPLGYDAYINNTIEVA